METSHCFCIHLEQKWKDKQLGYEHRYVRPIVRETRLLANKANAFYGPRVQRSVKYILQLEVA